MRSVNMIITGGIAACASAIAIYTSPVGTRELYHWAMTLGLLASAALVSWLFFVMLLFFKSNNLKGQLLILLGYAAALLCSVTAGGSFGVVYYLMQSENSTFRDAFRSASIVIVGGYAIASVILLGASFYLSRQGRSARVVGSSEATFDK